MISVLTGDIVGSQTLPPHQLAQLPAHLEAAIELSGLTCDFEVFGGDSWQATCQPPEAAINLAIVIRAALLGHHEIDTRLAIGIGNHDTLVPEKISLSQGEAFVLSGRGLKNLPADRRLAIHLSPEIPPAIQLLLQANIALLDSLTAEWTSKQAQAVALAQSKLPNTELAPQFHPPISPQAFGKHLASAKWPLLQEVLPQIQQSLAQTLA